MTTLWANAASQWQQQTGGGVFHDLGYEPNCIPRHEAREAGILEHLLPAPCGQCPQEQFHGATEYDVLYGGAAGGGKTKGLVMEGLKNSVRYPGITIGAFRRSYPELEESLLSELRPLLGDLAHHYGARYDETKHDLRFPSGSLIRFRHMGNLRDATRRQGGEYQQLLFDERTLTPPDAIDFLQSRLRSSRPDIPVLGIRSGTNPGGIGHGRVKRDYIDATDHGKHVVVDDRGRTRRFIQAKVEDNPHLNAEYASDLDALPEAMRKAFRDGNWDSFTGQVFTSWNRALHVVKAFPIPLSWRRFSGIDYGWRDPWAVVWGALDSDRRLWVYREISQSEVTERDQAARIQAIEHAAGEDLVHYADPSMWAKKGEAPSPATAYTAAGVRIVEATNDRIIGWHRLHTYLANAPACELHRHQGHTVCPLLHVLETCPEVIRTVPALPYDPVRVEDVDTNADDHIPDALRYLVMALPNPAPQQGLPRQPDPRHRDPLSQIAPIEGDLRSINF